MTGLKFKFFEKITGREITDIDSLGMVGNEVKSVVEYDADAMDQAVHYIDDLRVLQLVLTDKHGNEVYGGLKGAKGDKVRKQINHKEYIEGYVVWVGFGFKIRTENGDHIDIDDSLDLELVEKEGERNG